MLDDIADGWAGRATNASTIIVYILADPAALTRQWQPLRLRRIRRRRVLLIGPMRASLQDDTMCSGGDNQSVLDSARHVPSHQPVLTKQLTCVTHDLDS